MGTSKSVQSVDRAIAILMTLADQQDGLTLTDLAKQVGLAPQTTQSLVRTLQNHEWIHQGARGAPYRLGPGLMRLATQWHAAHGWLEAAQPLIRELGETIGEYVLLAEVQPGNVLPLLELQSDKELSVSPRTDFAQRYHCSAVGKIMLAAMPPSTRRRFIDGLELLAYGPKTITDANRLFTHIEEVERQGYAVCREETSAHVGALAVPIHNAAGHVEAGLGMCVPLTRFPASREIELLAHLRATAAMIEKSMGSS